MQLLEETHKTSWLVRTRIAVLFILFILPDLLLSFEQLETQNWACEMFILQWSICLDSLLKGPSHSWVLKNCSPVLEVPFLHGPAAERGNGQNFPWAKEKGQSVPSCLWFQANKTNYLWTGNSKQEGGRWQSCSYMACALQEKAGLRMLWINYMGTRQPFCSASLIDEWFQ